MFNYYLLEHKVQQQNLSNLTHQGTRKMCRIVQDVVILRFYIRNQPFNYVFFLFRNFFSDNTRVGIFIFFCRAKRNFFFQNLTLGYMTKTLNQIIFFFLHQNQNIFSATLGIGIFFQKKNIASPLEVKQSIPQLTEILFDHKFLSDVTGCRKSQVSDCTSSTVFGAKIGKARQTMS